MSHTFFYLLFYTKKRFLRSKENLKDLENQKSNNNITAITKEFLLFLLAMENHTFFFNAGLELRCHIAIAIILIFAALNDEALVYCIGRHAEDHWLGLLLYAPLGPISTSNFKRLGFFTTKLVYS